MSITKIKASEPKKDKPKKVKKPKTGIFKVFAKIGNYFKSAWAELRQVRWTDRRSTWKMTVAVIIFTGFFVGLIILLDYLFQLLFKVIIK